MLAAWAITEAMVEHMGAHADYDYVVWGMSKPPTVLSLVGQLPNGNAKDASEINPFFQGTSHASRNRNAGLSK